MGRLYGWEGLMRWLMGRKDCLHPSLHWILPAKDWGTKSNRLSPLTCGTGRFCCCLFVCFFKSQTFKRLFRRLCTGVTPLPSVQSSCPYTREESPACFTPFKMKMKTKVVRKFNTEFLTWSMSGWMLTRNVAWNHFDFRQCGRSKRSN